MTEEPTRGISRRTLAKGVAWSVPAVAVASAVPAYAASPGLPPVAPDIPNSAGCKWPGGGNPQCRPADNLSKGFRIYIPFVNNTGGVVTLTITGYSVTAGGACSRDYQAWEAGSTPAGLSYSISAGGSQEFWVTWHDDNSGNDKTLTVTYTYTTTDSVVHGPFSIPVAKTFNTTCDGFPQPTIPAGSCTVPPSEHSNCP